MQFDLNKKFFIKICKCKMRPPSLIRINGVGYTSQIAAFLPLAKVHQCEWCCGCVFVSLLKWFGRAACDASQVLANAAFTRRRSSVGFASSLHNLLEILSDRGDSPVLPSPRNSLAYKSRCRQIFESSGEIWEIPGEIRTIQNYQILRQFVHSLIDCACAQPNK